MTDQEYIESINKIPHLNLTDYLPPVPVEDMIKEMWENVSNIKPFEYSRNVSTKGRTYLEDHWQGFSIIDITERGDHMLDYYTSNITHQRTKELGIELGEDGFAIFKITDIGRRTPISTTYCKDLFEQLWRCRISRVRPNGVIQYHCHELKRHRNPDKLIPDTAWTGILHIPLITNSNCKFWITENKNQSREHADDFGIFTNQKEYSQQYNVGEIWMFNNYHYHKAENLGTSDRYHMLIYFDYMDKKIRPIIEQAILNYSGPIVG
jgi:hypothetical protein